MFKISFFYILLLIKKFSSLPDVEGFSPEGAASQNFVNKERACPCDLTANVCDFGCCCDPDCAEFKEREGNYYYDTFFSQCDSKDSYDKRVYSKLDYCQKFEKSIDDLYNPLTLAFKILKRGLCLVKDNTKKSTEENDYDINKIGTNNNNKEYITTEIQGTKTFDIADINEGDFMNFKAPITMPSGFCLFGAYKIRKNQNYEVTCTYPQDKNSTISDYYQIDTNINNYIINERGFYRTLGAEDPIYIKKVEIYYFGNTVRINRYFTTNDMPNYDFTLVVKFYSNENDYHKSGNPGYIKGKPILINRNRRELFRNDIVFPIEYDSYSAQTDPVYYDNYMDNKITFEDLIIYGYKDRQFLTNFFITDSDYYFGKYGNANISYNNDWKQINNPNVDNNDYRNLLFLGYYKDVGVVNNTQLELYELNIEKRNNDEFTKFYYFIHKLLKEKNSETKWWYAPGPGLIKFPRNIMYPFRVGTTNYQTKAR